MGKALRMDVVFPDKGKNNPPFPFTKFNPCWTHEGDVWNYVRWEKVAVTGKSGTLRFPEFQQDRVFVSAQLPMTLQDADDLIGQWRKHPHVKIHVLGTSVGVTASPDQSQLYVTQFHSHWVWSYQIQLDGSLRHKRRFFHLHVPDTSDSSGADGIRLDRDGRLYVATRMELQVCDQAGRVNCIIPTPNGKVSNLSFGRPKFDELYATCADKLFKRKVKAIGANAWDEPKVASAPRL